MPQEVLEAVLLMRYIASRDSGIRFIDEIHCLRGSGSCFIDEIRCLRGSGSCFNDVPFIDNVFRVLKTDQR